MSTFPPPPREVVASHPLPDHGFPPPPVRGVAYEDWPVPVDEDGLRRGAHSSTLPRTGRLRIASTAPTAPPLFAMTPHTSSLVPASGSSAQQSDVAGKAPWPPRSRCGIARRGRRALR